MKPYQLDIAKRLIKHLYEEELTDEYIKDLVNEHIFGTLGLATMRIERLIAEKNNARELAEKYRNNYVDLYDNHLECPLSWEN
jgi:hypothetical protein